MLLALWIDRSDIVNAVNFTFLHLTHPDLYIIIEEIKYPLQATGHQACNAAEQKVSFRHFGI